MTECHLQLPTKIRCILEKLDDIPLSEGNAWQALADELEALSKFRAEAVSRIFEPGFSTAQVATGVSGRGVGMDVVRKNIEQLHGTVEIKLTQNKEALVRARLMKPRPSGWCPPRILI